MAQEYTIGALWMEGSLSFLEQLCLKSFIDAGHRVVLYHYGPLQNVPDGIELADATDILPQTNFLAHARTGSPALHSDLFRYKMLEKNRKMIWADTDAYCMRPFETPNGHYHGWESTKHVNGGVLGLPHDSDTLKGLLEYTTDEFAIPSYYGPEYQAELEEKKAAGNPVHASEQPWGVWGPHAVSHFLHETGEVKYSFPQEVLYPFIFKDRRFMLKRRFDVTPYITDKTCSVHLYGRRMRARLVEKEGGAPHPKSLLGQLLIKHDIDPTKAPIKTRLKTAEAPVDKKAEKAARSEKASASAAPVSKPAGAKNFGGRMNLTPLADQYGVGAALRHTSLYDMLLWPHRDRAIEMLHMGALTHATDTANPVTRELPLAQLWLDYFPQGLIHSVSDTDFSWFQQDRFQVHTPDTTGQGFDIIIDDASASPADQLQAFVTRFAQMKRGGLYIIEDLREALDGTTAALFQIYLDTGSFAASDLPQADALNALRSDMSGAFVIETADGPVVVVHKV